jgi:hypothetical protein
MLIVYFFHAVVGVSRSKLITPYTKITKYISNII